MSDTRSALVRTCLVAVLLVALVPASAPALSAPQRVIVAYQDGTSEAVRGSLVGRGASVNAHLAGAHAFAVSLRPGLSMAEVATMPGVRLVEEDAVVTILKRPAPAPVVETLPWGVDRVEADAVWGTTTGDPVKVAVVDTGIDRTHPDLAGNLKGGYNAISPTVSWTDDNGHGTHVAGTIAAIDNTIGVIGVAPQADLYAVKVLNRRGSGLTSDIIEGIDWAITNDMDVINMSLGSSTYSSTFEAACTRAIEAGVVIVAAAGNSGPGDATVGYPAKYPGVIGVSATDSSNVIAYFSSRGDGVDIAAPGVSIYSTYRGGAYTTMSGTSMASPHVAGVVALILTQPDGNDGTWTPAEVQDRLQSTAQDLGSEGYDLLYGAGLVRADLAVAGPQ